MCRHQNHNQKALYKLEQLFHELQKPKLNHGPAVNRFAYAYAVRVSELAHAMFFLTDADSDAGMFPILRSMFDPAIRLMFLSLDPDQNIKKLELTEAHKRLKFIERALGYTESESVEIPDIKARIAELEADNVKRLPNIEQMIGKVSALPLYHGYSYASAYVHCSMEDLYNSVFSKRNSGTPILGNSIMAESQQKILWANCEILLDGSIKALDKFVIK